LLSQDQLAISTLVLHVELPLQLAMVHVQV